MAQLTASPLRSVLGGVDVHDQGLPRGALHGDGGLEGHPIVGVDDVEVLVGGDAQGRQRVALDFGHQVPGVMPGDAQHAPGLLADGVGLLVLVGLEGDSMG